MAEIELSRNGIVTLTAGRHSGRKSGKMSDVHDIRCIHSMQRSQVAFGFLEFSGFAVEVEMECCVHITSLA